MERKFQVFVSSTYTDLIDERQDVLKAVLDLGHIPSGMEGFFAADEDQLEYIKRIIDQCDYYILIIAGRYGSLHPTTGLSFTEMEYEYAVGTGAHVLAFIHQNPDGLAAGKVDTDPAILERLEAFKARVSERRVVSFWTNREQLRGNVTVSLAKATHDFPGTGWVRGNFVASEDVLAQLNQVRNDLDRLRAENEYLKSQLQPDVDGLAKLTEPFEIRYLHYDASGNYKYNKTLSLSWADIFKSVGPSFFSPHGTSMIEAAIKRHISELNGGHLPRSLRVYASDTETIKLQMAAYGFFHLYSAQSTQGGMAEFIQLTDAGKRVLIELSAIRSS